MMESVDINFNLGSTGGGGERSTEALASSINQLGAKLDTFSNSLNKLFSSADNFKKAQAVTEKVATARKTAAEASKIRAQVLQTPQDMATREAVAKASLVSATARKTAAEAAKIRAQVSQSPQGMAARDTSVRALLVNARARLTREQENRIYRAKASEAYEQGDIKLGDKYAQLMQNSTSKGVQEGFARVLRGTSIVAGAAFIANALGRNATLGGQIAQSAMTNPLLNYDYGSQFSSIASLGAQKTYGNLSAGLTGLGAGVGLLLSGFNPIGATIGGTLGSVLGGYMSATGVSKADVQAKALGELINERSATSAMRGTNTAAYNILTQRKGYTPMSIEGELDPIKPFMNEISKGAAIYDRNFNAIDKLTSYAISAQVPLNQLKQISGLYGQIRPSETQFDKMASLAGTYGIDIGSLMERTLQFMQGGMNKDVAANIAAQSFQNVSGFQAAQSSFYQGDYLDRTTQGLIMKYGAGINLEAAYAGDPKAMADLKAYHEVAGSAFSTDAIKSGEILKAQAILKYAGLPQSTYNLNTPESRELTSARMTPSAMQESAINLVRQTRITGATGNFDADKIVRDMSALSGVTSTTAATMQKLENATQSAASSLNTLANLAANGFNKIANNAATNSNPMGLYVVRHKKSYNNQSSLNRNESQ